MSDKIDGDQVIQSLPFAVCSKDDEGNETVFALVGNKPMAEELLSQLVFPRLREGEWRRWFILNTITQARHTI